MEQVRADNENTQLSSPGSTLVSVPTCCTYIQLIVDG